MDEYESLSHTKWECKYHAVFIPKCRRKTLYVGLRKHLGEVFRRLAEQKESRIEEGHLMSDHVHMLIAIPPKYAVSQVVGFMKGKSAIHLARVYGERKRNFVGATFLGARVFRVYSGTRRRVDPNVHPATGAGGQTPGSTEPGTLRRPPKGGQKWTGPR
jgi:putative transposase